MHDRVREAAYALIPTEGRQEVHLSIGRLLWARSGQPPRDEDLLEILRQLRLAAHGIADADERIEVARLHLRAGRKAKAAAAYQAAADHFAAGIELLGPEGWERDHELSFSLHLKGAESAYLSGALERAEALFDVALPRAQTGLARARIHNLRVILSMTLGKHAEAVKAGLAGLSCLGVTLPETAAERQAAFSSGVAEIDAALEGRRVEDLVDAKAVDDPELYAALQLLVDMTTPIYHAEPDLYAPSIIKFVLLSLKHGHSNLSAFGYMSYGYIVTTFLKRPAEGLAFGRLSFALNDKFPNTALVAKLNITFAYFLCFSEPFRAAIPYLERGLRAALSCGDFIFFSINCSSTPMLKLGAGYPLDELRAEVDKSLVLMQRTRDVTATAILTIVKQVIAHLQGRTRSRDSLSDESFDEDHFVARLDKEDPTLVSLYYCLLKLQVHSFHGEHEAVLALARKAEPMLGVAAGIYFISWFHFHPCLSWLALSAAESPEEEARREAAIARHRAEIERLAAMCPQNYRHQLLLIEARTAQRAGKHAEAIELYDQAITLAKQNEFPQDEALANELCAKMLLATGRARAARGYLGDAYLGYLHWGAQAVAEDLERDHGHLFPSFTADKRRRAAASRSSSSTTTTTTTRLGQTLGGNVRDAARIVRTAQAIAGETMLPKVIERLVADLWEANETVRRINERLEAEVAQRTEELYASNQELGAANERLQIELGQREQAEQARAALQEQMIEAQRARLSEMSTPFIPITDRIMVMPLIGTVDSERAEQVLEAALGGAQRHRARVVILDITGIKHVDTYVIRTLLRTASALHLLGTQAVLTGIRPEVAQTIVQLGTDVGAIITKGTLQSGIAYALQRSGEIVGEGSSERGAPTLRRVGAPT